MEIRLWWDYCALKSPDRVGASLVSAKKRYFQIVAKITKRGLRRSKMVVNWHDSFVKIQGQRARCNKPLKKMLRLHVDRWQKLSSRLR